MGIAGAKPTTQALKDLHRTARKDRRRNEPVAVAGDLVPSDQVDKTTYAREIWDHTVHFAPRGMLKPIDVPLLERYCIALALARQAQEKVNEAGLIVRMGIKRDKKTGVVTDDGYPAQNPYLPIVNRQSDLARKLAAELALPVTARARIDMSGAVPEEPMAKAKAGKKRERKLADLDTFIANNPQAQSNETTH